MAKTQNQFMSELIGDLASQLADALSAIDHLREHKAALEKQLEAKKDKKK